MTNSRPAGSTALLRRLKSATVFRAVRETGPVSRAELAGATGRSKPTANGAVELLPGNGCLTEGPHEPRDEPPRPGRRGRPLRFAGRMGQVLGVDIGADKVPVDPSTVVVGGGETALFDFAALEPA